MTETASDGPITHFCTDPEELAGRGGAYVRGEAALPEGAIWLPHGHDEGAPRARPLLWMALVAAATLVLLADARLALCPLVLWSALALHTRWRTRHLQRLPSRAGHHGVLLLDDHIVYRVDKDCAVVHRQDITGIERRKGSGRSVTGAFTLAGRTGRGALPCPQPGLAALRQLDAWFTTPAR